MKLSTIGFTENPPSVSFTNEHWGGIEIAHLR